MGNLSKMPRAEQWADRISIELGKTVESIIETGRLLNKAKADLAHGEWGRMFTERLIPLSQRTANEYMTVASHPTISSSRYVANLPNSRMVLYDLARVPEPVLKNALADGLITPDMERKQVSALLPPKERKEAGSDPVVVTPRPVPDVKAEGVQEPSHVDGEVWVMSPIEPASRPVAASQVVEREPVELSSAQPQRAEVDGPATAPQIVPTAVPHDDDYVPDPEDDIDPEWSEDLVLATLARTIRDVASGWPKDRPLATLVRRLRREADYLEQADVDRAQRRAS